MLFSKNYYQLLQAEYAGDDMAKKKKKKNTGKDIQKTLFDVSLMPQGQAAITLSEILPVMKDSESGEVYAPRLSDVLGHVMNETKRLRDNSLDRIEDVLMSHVMVMDALFHKSVMAAHRADNLEHKNTYMNMAFKAQLQIRSTAEAIADIKNPRTYIQQNMSYRPQVNNGTVLNAYAIPDDFAFAEIPKSTNKLLTDGRTDHETLDIGREKAAVGNDKGMVPLEGINRAANRRRQRSIKNERNKARIAQCRAEDLAENAARAEKRPV